MPISSTAIFALLMASSQAFAAAAVTASAKAAPSSYVSGSTTATGDPLLAPSPAPAAAGVSPVAEAEPDVEDDAEKLSATAALDLNLAETRLLAKISETMTLEMDSIFFNLEENAPAEKPGFGVNEINAVALYAELAKRAIAEESAARQALSLAILRGDTRAKAAKDEAFENRIADSLIKRFDNGDKGAKDELMKQALKGNKKARAYLGLDKPIVVGIPEAMTPGAKVSAGAAAAAASATAEEHKPSIKESND